MVVLKIVTQMVVQITHLLRIIRIIYISFKTPLPCDIYVIKIRPFSPSLNRTYMLLKYVSSSPLTIPPLISTGLNRTEPDRPLAKTKSP